MRHEQFRLMGDEFVAGQTRDYQWSLLAKDKTPYNAEGATGNFALIEYSHRFENEPILSKPIVFIEAGLEYKNVATVTLLPDDTKDLFGKYIYQITIKDSQGEVEIPGQGIILITKNTNEAFLSS